MSLRYKGGVISATPPTPSASAATGVWTLEQQLQAEAAGNWPSQPPVFGESMRSLRFNSADTTYLARTPASAGNRKTWTISLWIKRSKLGARQDLFVNTNTGGYVGQYFEFFSDDTLMIGDYPTSGGFIWQLVTTQVFRDLSAWYHIVVALDTTQATSSNRVKIYVNGSQVTSFATATYPTQNLDAYWNSTAPARFGYALYNDQAQNGYATEMVFIDGQALTPSSFGQTNSTTGVWEPKAITGLTYGTNGFYLNFQDNSGTTATTLGKDSSGNGNNWTPNNFSVTAGIGNDSLVDTPYPYGTDTGAGGEVRGNYCTWNPLDNAGTLANGNLDFSNSGSNNKAVRSTFAFPSAGKWYAEFRVGTTTSSTKGIAFGAATAAASLTAGGSDNRIYIYSDDTGGIYSAGSTITNTLGTFAAGTILQVAYDGDTGKIWIGKDNTWYNSSGGTTGNPGAGTNQTATLTGTYFLYALCYAEDGVLNAGQRAWSYTAPSGFKALCTQNLPTPTTVQPDDYFNTVLYTGNGSSQSITGVGFQPDLVWLKSRTSGGSSFTNHVVVDAVRGAGTNGYKNLYPNLTNAEVDPASGNESITALNSDGFTLGGNANTNTNTMTAVAWNWKANGAGSSNTQGTITSTVSANTTSGFSVVTYTGTGSSASVGHGLGAAPQMIIVKGRTNAVSWVVYSIGLTAGYEIYLNSTNAQAVSSNFGSAPTSTVFNLGTDTNANGNGVNYVAYCFAPVAGFSAFGSYTGNGSTDGPFVYTGFRPAFVMVKGAGTVSGSNGDWRMQDNVRSTYNAVDKTLYANLSNAEDTYTTMDILSNGFKLRTTAVGFNENGISFIYMAFAQNPFKYALAR